MTDPGLEKLLQHSAWLEGLTRKLAREEHMAADLAQDAMVAALQSPPSEPERARGWLAGVVRRLAFNRRRGEARRERRERLVARRDEEPEGTDILERVEIKKAVASGVLELDEPYQQIVLLRYFEEIDTGTIARVLGCSENTVRSRLRRAHILLRQRLGKLAPNRGRQGWSAIILYPSFSSPGGSAATSAATVGSLGGLLMSTKNVAMSVVALVLIACGVLWFSQDEEDPLASSRTGESVATQNPGNPESRSEGKQIAADPTPLTEAVELEKEIGITPVTGLVVEALSRAPVPGARVILYGKRHRLPAQEHQRLLTDADGRYQFPGLTSPEGYEVLVLHPGYLAVRTEISLYPYSEVPTVELAEGIRITGEVRNEKGQRVGPGMVYVDGPLRIAKRPDRELIYRSPGNPLALPVLEKGRFEVSVPPQLSCVMLSIPGYRTVVTDPFVPEAGQHLELTAQRGNTLEGFVRGPSGKVVSDALIQASPIALDTPPDSLYQRYASRLLTRTDTSGLFSLGGMTDRVTIRVSHPEYLFCYMSRIPVTEEPMEIELRAAAWLTGRAVTTEGRVLAGLSGRLEVDSSTVRVLTDHEGRFRTPPIDPERESGSIAFPGVEHSSLEWPGGVGEHELGNVTFMSAPVHTFRVHASHGDPVIGALILAGAPTVLKDRSERLGVGITGADGEARVPIRPEAGARAYVERAGYFRQEVALDTEEKRTHSVSLSPQARLSGVVVSREEEPVAWARVELTDNGPDARRKRLRDPMVFTLADRQGRFSLPVSEGSGDYLLTVRCSGFDESKMKVEISPGEDRDLGLVILPGGAVITGTVTDSEGRPVPGALLEFDERVPNFHREVREYSTITDARGRISLSGVNHATFRVAVTAEGFLPAPLDVVIDSDTPPPLDVTLVRGSAFRGLVVGPDGEPVPGARIHASAAAQSIDTAADGSFVLLVPQGPVMIAVRADGFLRYTIKVSNVDELPERITLDRGAILRAAVKMPEGVAIPTSLKGHLSGRGSMGRSAPVVDGIAEFAGLREGTFNYSLGAPGHPRSFGRVTLTNGEVATVDYPGVNFSTPILVRVSNAEDEQIAGARIQLWKRRSGGGSSVGTFTTRNDGCCEISGLHEPQIDLRVRAPGYAPGEIVGVATQIRGDEFEVVLEKEGTLRVVVTDQAGHPVPDLQVRVHGKGTSLEAVTFEDGGATLRGLSTADYGITVRRQGQVVIHTTHSVEAGIETLLELTLPDSLEVVGILRRNGKPVTEGSVALRYDRNHTTLVVGAEGFFHGAVLEADKYDVFYVGGSSTRTTVRLGSVKKPSLHELVFDYQGFDLTVKVVDDTGKATSAQGLQLRSSSDDQTGAYTFLGGHTRTTMTGLPAGEYVLTAQTKPGQGRAAGPMRISLSSDLEITYALLASAQVEIKVDGPRPELVHATCLHDDAVATPLHVSGHTSILLEWPRGMEGHGVLETTVHAPVFFTVREGQALPDPVRFEPGGLLVFEFETQRQNASYRLRPEGTIGFPSYWRNRNFRTSQEQHLEPGRYVVTIETNGTLEEKTVTITEATTTTVGF